jgi:SPP1 gp7 family putative phage head morphogenesis protein
VAVTEEVIDLVRLSKERTVALTDEQVVALTRAWVDAWDELEPEFQNALTVLLADAEDTIPARIVARDQRITQALQHAADRLDGLASTTQVTVTNDLHTIVLDAANTKYDALLRQLPDGAEHAWLNRLNTVALDAIVARTTQQIHSATMPLPDDTVRAMQAELVRGITVGANPNETARRMVRRTGDHFYGGLTRATRIARTETLDAYRTADLAAAQANRTVIASRVWMATLDARTCASCLANHGTEWPIDQFGPEDHQQGRCVFVEKTKSWEELGFTGIEDQSLDLEAQRDAWWDNLTDDTKQQILGPGKYELWQDGSIDWADLTKRVDNPGWRPSQVETPLVDLT